MTEFNFLPDEPTDELPYSTLAPGVTDDDLDGGRYRSRFEKQVERADEDEGSDD